MYEIGGSARRVPPGGPEGGPVLCPSSFFLVVIGHPLGHRRGSPVLPLSWGLLFVPISFL